MNEIGRTVPQMRWARNPAFVRLLHKGDSRDIILLHGGNFVAQPTLLRQRRLNLGSLCGASLFRKRTETTGIWGI